MIEKLDMHRRFSRLAPIVNRPHQSFSKMPLPDAIYNDARSERVGGACQPVCELETTAAFHHRWLRQAREDFGEVLRDRLARGIQVSSDEHPLIYRRPVGYGASQFRIDRHRFT